MKETVSVTIEVPVDLYVKWTRRKDDGEANLSARLLECLRRHYNSGPLPERQPAAARDPQLQHKVELSWGHAWSRRWDDLTEAEQHRASDARMQEKTGK